MSPNYVYRARDADGCVLYVGLTSQPFQRQKKHTANAPWRDLVKMPFDWVEFETRGDATAFERQEIERLKPRFNKQCNPDMRAFPPGEAPARVNLLVPPAVRIAWKKKALDDGITMQQLIIDAMNFSLKKSNKVTAT